MPREDESLLAIPPLVEAASLVSANQAALTATSCNVQGRTLARLRHWTREQIGREAGDWTAERIGAAPADANWQTVIVTGHQPTLFHPGVWAKNFAAAGLARQTQGTALNLIIDNDVVAARDLRIPAGDRERPRQESLPFDASGPPVPWEDARILDRGLFATFGERVTGRMACWNVQPLVGGMWPRVQQAAAGGASPGDALTIGRAWLERQWGRGTFEFPLSRFCQLDPILWIASHLLAHAPRFREVHNDVLAEHRRTNRIRSRTHPVPELQSADGWTEAPFWLWSRDDPQRRRVYVRQLANQVEVADGRETVARLPLTPQMDACCAVEALRDLAARGIRFRTRALTTTLFARLALADLFIHGIGGAKYDEMTDRIIVRFFGIEPPAFLTLSATLHLPLGERHAVSVNEVLGLRARRRDLAYNPERHVSDAQPPEAGRLIEEKRQLIAEQHAAAARRGLSRRERRRHHRENHQRFRLLREIRDRLAALAGEERQRLERELQLAEQQSAANRLLENREYSFCLYPEEKLRPFLTSLETREVSAATFREP